MKLVISKMLNFIFVSESTPRHLHVPGAIQLNFLAKLSSTYHRLPIASTFANATPGHSNHMRPPPPVYSHSGRIISSQPWCWRSWSSEVENRLYWWRGYWRLCVPIPQGKIENKYQISIYTGPFLLWAGNLTCFSESDIFRIYTAFREFNFKGLKSQFKT